MLHIHDGVHVPSHKQKCHFLIIQHRLHLSRYSSKSRYPPKGFDIRHPRVHHTESLAVEIVPKIKLEQHRQAHSHNLLVDCTEHCICRPARLQIDLYDIFLALLSHFLEDLQVKQANFALLAQILLQFYSCSDTASVL